MTRLTLLDGGMGRELKRIGAPFSQPLWSAQALIESPDHVRQAHQGFIDSGAEIITVNSYACVPFHLGDSLYRSDGPRLAREAAVIAQAVACQANRAVNPEAGSQPVQVAGSIPPAFGSYRPDLFKAEEARVIATELYQAQDPHVDLWLAETMASLEEFEVIQSVLKDAAKICYYSFTLDDSAAEARLRSGQPVAHAAAAVCKAGGAGIFFNCSVPEVMEQAINEARTVIAQQGNRVTIGVFANSFTPIGASHEANSGLQSVRELTPADYLAFAQRWHEAGAAVIGGCCGITPDHIRALSHWQRTLAH